MKRVLVTRPEPDAGELSGILRESGFDAISFPTFQIQHVSCDELAPAIDAARDGDGKSAIVFTSRHAVERVRGMFSPRILNDFTVWSVGPATTANLTAAGVKPDMVAKPHNAGGLIKSLRDSAFDYTGWDVLYPCAREPRPELGDGLSQLGMNVTPFVVYESVATTITTPVPPSINVIIFASPTAAHFFDLLPAAEIDPVKDNAIAVCIGPTTYEAVRQLSFRHVTMADSPTTPGIMAAVEKVTHKES